MQLLLRDKRHRWNLKPHEAIRLQREFSRKLILRFPKKDIKTLVSCDVAFSKRGNTGFACVCIFNYPQIDLVDKICIKGIIKYPYIPGLLTFREAPLLLKAIKKIKQKVDVFMFDGQGIAHPRRMGIAAHIGLWLDEPTLGCAKSSLFGKFDNPADKKGRFGYILDKEGERIGACLRTRDYVKPVYVSPGHKMDIKTAVRIVLSCSIKYRIPEPLRVAHNEAVSMRINDRRHL